MPLALPSFLDTVEDAYLRKTIRLGRPGRIMPAFDTLSDAQVDAIVAHVRQWGTRPAPEYDETPVHGDAKKGRELYLAHCAECHGEQGEGGKGTGVTFSRPRDLPIMPPALNNPGFLSAASDAMIKRTLMRGRLGTPMKSFVKEGLSESDIDDLVSYIRSFDPRYAQAFETAPEPIDEDSAVIRFESPYGLKETIEAVEQAVIGANFIHIRTQLLEQGMVAEGEENPRQAIVYFCNFNFLNAALQVDPRIGMFLPCRVTVVERAGRVEVMSINPLRLSRLFNNDELKQACRQMYGVYRELMENATL